MATQVSVHAEFTVEGLAGKVLLDHTWAVMDRLLNLEKENASCVHSSAVSVDAGKGLVTIEISASGRDYDAAQDVANAALHTALLAAGEASRGWRQSVSRTESVDS